MEITDSCIIIGINFASRTNKGTCCIKHSNLVALSWGIDCYSPETVYGSNADGFIIAAELFSRFYKPISNQSLFRYACLLA